MKALMKRLSLLCITGLLLASAQLGWGQTVQLAEWTFGGSSGWGLNVKDPATTASNVTVGGLTRGPGLTTSGTAAGSAWGANGFYDNISAASQDATTAIANENFITIALKANSGYSVSLEEIGACNLRRSGTGPSSVLWQYSLDSITFTDITNITLVSTASAGNNVSAIDVSGISALQNVPSTSRIFLRIVMWNASSQNGTWYFNAGPSDQPFSLSGTITSTPLPLELLSFKGQQQGNANRLEWVTAAEKNVNWFELERATDGQHFSKVTTVKATGNNSTLNNYYQYADQSNTATAYYRLRMVDVDGSARYSGIVVLRNNGAAAVTIYPNPVAATLFVEGAGNTAYQVTDLSGRSVLQGRTAAEGNLTAIDVAALPAGIYLLTCEGLQSSEAFRFVKK